MRTKVLAVILIGPAACSTRGYESRGPDPLPRSPSPESRLIELLEDPRPEVRDQAEAELARLGEEVRGAIARAQGSSDSEVRLRAGRLYRKLCASRLELILGAPWKGGNSLFVACSMRNGSDIALVVVKGNFYYESRIAHAVCPPEGEIPRWRVERWTHGCADVHPFTPEDFVVLPPGETRYVGYLDLCLHDLPREPFRIAGRYSYRRPERLDPMYLSDPAAHRLYESALEIEGIVSAPIDIDPRTRH